MDKLVPLSPVKLFSAFQYWKGEARAYHQSETQKWSTQVGLSCPQKIKLGCEVQSIIDVFKYSQESLEIKYNSNRKYSNIQNIL